MLEPRSLKAILLLWVRMACKRHTMTLMKKKILSAATAGALALSTVAVAPAVQAQPVQTNYAQNTKNTKNTKKTDASSEAGSVIGLLVIGATILGLYGFFSPYNPNGAFANAAR